MLLLREYLSCPREASPFFCFGETRRETRAVPREFNYEESGQDTMEYVVLAAVLASVVEGSESLSKTLSHEMKRITHEIKSLRIG